MLIYIVYRMTTQNYTAIPDDTTIRKTVENLKKNNINVIIVDTKEQAKETISSLIPHGSEVMNMTSITVDTIGVTEEVLHSGKYNAVRNTFAKMDRATQGKEMRKLGSVPDYATGSVHAITQDGHVLIASASGSQLPAYIYGAEHVIWVAGAQKIVKDLNEGMKRIYEYSFPLENKRALKAYGSGSNVRKILIVNSEPRPNRVTMVLIKESIGF